MLCVLNFLQNYATFVALYLANMAYEYSITYTRLAWRLVFN